MEEKSKEFSEERTDGQIPAAPEQTEKPPFVPSPKWKRVFAWVLFGIVIIGIITWLLNMACPDWIDFVKDWARNLLGL